MKITLARLQAGGLAAQAQQAFKVHFWDEMEVNGFNLKRAISNGISVNDLAVACLTPHQDAYFWAKAAEQLAVHRHNVADTATMYAQRLADVYTTFCNRSIEDYTDAWNAVVAAQSEQFKQLDYDFSEALAAIFTKASQL